MNHPHGQESDGPARSWVFTVNNYPENYPENLRALAHDPQAPNPVRYLVVGREVGESGTPHLQGCITFKNMIRRRAVSALIPNAYVAKARSVVHARKYCTKEDSDPIVVDNLKQGERTDLHNATDLVKEGGVAKLIEDEPHMYVRYHAGFEKLEARLFPHRNPEKPPEVVWLYGPTGTGKTRYVYEKTKDMSLWSAMATAKWWEGYVQQDAILIDDMRSNFATFNDLLKILDRYPYTQEKKGSSVPINSRFIYITSQFPPHKVYCREKRAEEDIRQLYRRITQIIHVGVADADIPTGAVSWKQFDTNFVVQDAQALIDADNSASAEGFNAPAIVPPTLSPGAAFPSWNTYRHVTPARHITDSAGYLVRTLPQSGTR